MPSHARPSTKVTPLTQAEVVAAVQAKIEEHVIAYVKTTSSSTWRIAHDITDGRTEGLDRKKVQEMVVDSFTRHTGEKPDKSYIARMMAVGWNATPEHYRKWERQGIAFNKAYQEFTTKKKTTPTTEPAEDKSWVDPDMGTEERSEAQDKEMQEETKTHTPTHKPTAPPPSTKPKPTEASSFERAMNIVQDHFERDSSKKDVFMYKMHDDGTFTQSDHFRWAQNHDKVYLCYSKTTEEMVTMRSNAVELDEEISEKESQENAA